MAKEIFAEEEKIAVDKEVAAIKKYKDFRERNEEIYKLSMSLVKAAIGKGNLNAAAMALAQANTATGQIKPIATDANQPDPEDKPGIDRAIEEMKARNDARQRPGA